MQTYALMVYAFCWHCFYVMQCLIIIMLFDWNKQINVYHQSIILLIMIFMLKLLIYISKDDAKHILKSQYQYHVCTKQYFAFKY